MAALFKPFCHEAGALAFNFNLLCISNAGVPAGAASLADDAMASLIEQYCREAGVRNLKKQLEKVYRKVAFKLVEAGAGPRQGADAGADAAGAGTGAASSATAGDAGAGPASVAGGNGGESTSESGASSQASGEAPAAQAQYAGPPIHIAASDLKDYVGQPPFASDRLYEGEAFECIQTCTLNVRV